MNNLSAIILTYNEEQHLDRCLNSLKEVCSEIFIVDSFSTDKTKSIAENYGGHFLQNKWINYATQFNWGIANASIKTDWILRIDADEYLSPQLIQSLKKELATIPDSYNGIRVKRIMYFMNKPLKKAGMYPIWHLKIWRKGTAICEQRWMDERMCLTSGEVFSLEGDLIDHNLNNITWWTQKHNNYATREAIDILDHIYNFTGKQHMSGKLIGSSEDRRRWLKTKYYKMPLFIRPFLFFNIRYFLQGGILEGKRGFIWNLLQCFWYRFLVDVKIDEAYKAAGKDRQRLLTYFYEEYGFDLTKVN